MVLRSAFGRHSPPWVLLVDCFPSASSRRIFLISHPASLRGCVGNIVYEIREEGRQRKRVGGRGRQGWGRTRGALNCREMLTPGGDGAGINEHSPPRRGGPQHGGTWVKVVSCVRSLLPEPASDSQCRCPGSASSAALRSSMCCQCLSDFPNKEIRLPLGSAETVRMHCI